MTSSHSSSASLTLGPILYHWPVEKWLDFYRRIADEAPVAAVCLGEVICAKRAPFYEKHYMDMAERLQRGGKKVRIATIAQVTVPHDRKTVSGVCDLNDENILIEANDVSALPALQPRPHTIGPFLNVYNERTLRFLAQRGAAHFSLPPELPARALKVMGQHAKDIGVTLEMQVFGRVPLALSARCYHARAEGRIKDNCQYACGNDPDGLTLKTLEGQDFLTINGIQTLSHGCFNLLDKLAEMEEMGVASFRLSPQDCDMVKVAETFHAMLGKRCSPNEARAKLAPFWPEDGFINGFYHKQPGHVWVAA